MHVTCKHQPSRTSTFLAVSSLVRKLHSPPASIASIHAMPCHATLAGSFDSFRAVLCAHLLVLPPPSACNLVLVARVCVRACSMSHPQGERTHRHGRSRMGACMGVWMEAGICLSSGPVIWSPIDEILGRFDKYLSSK